VIPSGERHKTLDNAARVWAALASMGAHRGTPLVALGGGVITDLGGFCASVYARGLPWVAVPTTVLAMADAAIGGKTAIDLPQGKNLVGAFHPPVAVLADPDVLRTLPVRHVRNGLAEVAKMHLLGGVRRGLPEIHALASAIARPATLGDLIRNAALRKHAMVARDPRETRGVRILLNLGHTVGHALEAATHYDGSVLHGEAVAIGIVVACRVSEQRGHLRPGETDAVAEALSLLNLPVALPRTPGRTALTRYVSRDKKRSTRSLRMVLPRSAGTAIVEPVEQEELLASCY
jgi:3-dehydroquinate synthase